MWLFCLQQVDDVLVLVGVVKWEFLGHQLLSGDLPAQQNDFSGDILRFELCDRRHYNQRRASFVAAEGVGADPDVEGNASCR